MNVNRKKIIIGIVIIVIILLVGFFYYNMNKDIIAKENIREELSRRLNIEEKSFEYGEEISVEKLNLPSNVRVYIENQELIDSYKLERVGNYKLILETEQVYSNFLNKKDIIKESKEVIIEVDDTKKPIIENVSNKVITVGDDIDLKAGITARDEIDGNLEIAIEGEVNTKIAGDYNIKVSAKDKNGNVAEESYIVKVNSKPEVKNYNGSVRNSSKSLVNKNTSNNSTSTGEKSQKEQSTYKYETYGDKVYFEEDRGENGNYSEKFTW